MATMTMYDRALSDYPPRPQLSRPPSRPKELLVFVLYVAVGNMSTSQARSNLSEFKGIMDKWTTDIERDTKYKVSSLVLPRKNGDTELKCVFPRDQEDIDLSSITNNLTEENLLP